MFILIFHNLQRENYLFYYTNGKIYKNLKNSLLSTKRRETMCMFFRYQLIKRAF